MKKKPKQGVKYWKAKAWYQFSRFIRLRDALETTGTKDMLVCCTCERTVLSFGTREERKEQGGGQAGHYVGGRSNAVLFLEDCVHGQCERCNDKKRGNGMPIEYRDFMDNKYGKERRLAIEDIRHMVVKFTPAELEGIRDEYKQKYNDLKGK